MKFLVIRKPRMGTGMRPTAEMVRAQKELLLDAVKRGEADCAYAFLGGGGFSIQNANSAEDLNHQYSERRFRRRLESEDDGLAARLVL